MKTQAKLKDISFPLNSKHPVVTLEVDADAQDLEKYLDKDLDFEIKPHREKRSLNANALLWACLGEIGQELTADPKSVYLYMLRRYGKFTTIMVKPEAVEAVKREWRDTEEVGEIDWYGKTMIQLNCYFGSSTYNQEEFSHLLDGVISEMKEMGLETPPSRDMRRVLEQWEEAHDKAR